MTYKVRHDQGCRRYQNHELDKAIKFLKNTVFTPITAGEIKEHLVHNRDFKAEYAFKYAVISIVT